MNYNFPETIFVEKNTVREQINYIISELKEVSEAVTKHDLCPHDPSSKAEVEAERHVLDEINDVDQTIETLRRIIPEQMEDARQRVIRKNQNRGYYVQPVPEAETLCICGHVKSQHLPPSAISNFDHSEECGILKCICKTFTEQFVTPAPQVEQNFTDDQGYEPLTAVFLDALHQAQHGKGRERHAQDLPFVDQPIMMIPKLQGSDKGLTYQVMKKVQESERMEPDAAIRERLGAMNYLAASILWLKNNG